MFKKWLLVFCCLFGVSVVSAQEAPETLEPKYGTHVVAPGFLPDPYIVTVRGGGDINASTEIDGCVGFIAETPDAAFVYETPASGFRIFFISDQDATLIIQKPDGSYLCNDDSVQLDPAVEVLPGGAGTYLVWVGSFNADASPAGYLMLTEVYETLAGNILTPIANFVTTFMPIDEFIGPVAQQEDAGE